MPSGPRSYGGGGGSRSSGGSRGSGGFRSSGGSRGRSYGGPGPAHIGPRRPIRFHFGPRVYVVANQAVSKIFLFLVVAFFAMVFAFAGSVGIKSNKGYLEEMKKDSSYYQNLVQTGTVTTATIVDYYEAFEYNGYYYYQIEYSYVDEAGENHTGQTYANYTSTQVRALNGKIKIAYDADGYSIPVTYTLEDVEYNYINAEYKSDLRTLIISVAVIVLMVLLVVVTLIKNIKRQNEEEIKKQEAQKAEAEAQKPRYCEYCGARLEAGAVKCDNCGARID